MPKCKKFLDLSRRQQQRRLLIQQECDNSASTRKQVNILQNTDNPAVLQSPELDIDDTEITSLSDTSSEDEQLQYTKQSVICPNIREELRAWACKYNVTGLAFTALLRILTEQNIQLPSDARSILHTPRSSIVRKCGNGDYFHYGLRRALIEQLQSGINVEYNIYLNLNIDGLPLTKSSNSQF